MLPGGGDAANYVTDPANSFCVDQTGNDVLVVPQAAQEGEDDHGAGEQSSGTSEGQVCHFHAGVE